MEEYLELLFGEKYNKDSFDFGKAVENVDVSYEQFREKLSGNNQLKCEIDEGKMYYFMLYNCYEIYAYPIKVINSQSLYIWFKAKYSPEELEEIRIGSKCFGKKVTSILDPSDIYDKVVHNRIVDAIKTISVSDFSKMGKVNYEIANAKDYLLKAHKRDYISILIYRLSKLFLLIEKSQEEGYDRNKRIDFDYKMVNKNQRHDIVKIIAAFGLWDIKKATNNDFSKIITDDLSGEMLDRDRVYLSNGVDSTFYALPIEIEQELLNKPLKSVK